MQESAEQNHKYMKFKMTITHILRVQRGYKRIKLRRVIKRLLLDAAWEKFFNSQKAIAQSQELALKKQKQASMIKRKDTVVLPAQLQSSSKELVSDQPTVLRLR